MGALKSAVIFIVIAAVAFALNQFFQFSWQQILLVTAAIAVVYHDNRIRDLFAEIDFLRERIEDLEDRFGK
ncbi:hypothetical protein ACQZ46_02475 [Agrobacterium salinitolerans]